MKAMRLAMAMIIPGTLALLAAQCDQKPGTAMCGRYYRNVVRLSRTGSQAIANVVAAPAAKQTVMDYCLDQPRFQIECGIDAASLSALQACETSEKKTIFDSLPDFESLEVEEPLLP
ncbi:MAG: hypothetical protein KDK39_06945 [Leptospiraceae bacterium]|nr:hypothetical protein [Leptospiraceae bacterium]